jgi:hypothetical protein
MTFNVTSSVKGWRAFLGTLNHGEMTRITLKSLGWTDEMIGEIPDYANAVDTDFPHPSKSNHRVGKYQRMYQEQYHGEKCDFPGAEWSASRHIALARDYYAAGNKKEAERHLGYAIHYIQDALCPPHIFPFQEGFFGGAHFDFETYVASSARCAMGGMYKNGPGNADFEPGGFTRENREMGGLGIYWLHMQFSGNGRKLLHIPKRRASENTSIF